MSLRDNVREEFKRSPLAVIATVAGVAVAILALLVAWLQYAGQPFIASSNPTGPAPSNDLQLSNLLVVISFFLAASFSAASLIRMLERTHPFPAMVLSVPAAVGASFSTLLILKLAPPRLLTPELINSARETVFWGTLFVFVAINGLSVLRDFVDTKAPQLSADATQSSEGKSPDGLASLAGTLIMLAVWGGLVSAGLSMLTQLFLT